MPPRNPGRRAASNPLVPDAGHAVVRMYGQGLGDCFLLALPREGKPKERPIWVVIDCGIIPSTPGGPERMRRVVRDLRAATTWDGAPLADDGAPAGQIDLLVLTHEHMDHLSGFLDLEAGEEWSRMRVQQVWMAWTEQPTGEGGLSDDLRSVRAVQREALLAAARRAQRFGLAETEAAILGVLEFEGEVRTIDGRLGFSKRADQAFDEARRLPAEPPIACSPGEVRAIPNTGVLAYVLGPPHGALLHQPDPTPSNPETYEAAAAKPVPADPQIRPAAAPQIDWIANGPSPFNAFAMPLLRADPLAARDAAGPDRRAAELNDLLVPFDRYVRVPIPAVEASAAAYSVLRSYYDDTNHWRRVDDDWLEPAEQFGVQLGDLTNNTSLVLAFELPPKEPGAERNVLLFVADAMVGNWLSWDEITDWKPIGGANPAKASVTAKDLLGRTVFYKVGHHGSHNATLKAKGLERMPAHGELTAFVPVSPYVARAIKGWCEMPLDVLMDALAERTGGKVVLSVGNVWPPLEGAALAKKLDAIGVELADDRFDENRIPELNNPLWAQIAIPF